MKLREKKLTAFLIVLTGAFSLFLPVSAQDEFTDTISIGEVVINGKASEITGSGYKILELDHTLLNASRQVNIAEVLSANSFIFIKSYGPGASATTSLRGAGASQTQVTWNGININSPMPGMADLSLIPSAFIDKAQILYGGASMSVSAGGLGGIINLETKPQWNDETSITVNPGLGSFGRYTGSFEARSGTANFQSVTKAFIEAAENNFSYLNNVSAAEPFREIRKNNQVKQHGFIQELYLKRRRSLSSARVWYQSAERNLPSPMIVGQDAGERQEDRSLRTILNHDLFSGNIKYTFTGAAVFDRLNYFNRLAGIDSRNLSGKFILNTKMEASLRNALLFTASLNNELSAVQSNNYNGNVSRNVFNATASLEKKMTARWGATLLVREIINKGELLVPDFTAGMEVRLADGKDHFLKASFSRNSKVPGMNDLYWIPGGNPGLRNEYGLLAEVAYSLTAKLSSRMDLFIDLSLFRNSLGDMISWHPGEFSYWTADNISRVNSAGSETTAALTWSRDRVAARLTGGISFTRAKPGSSDKQLIYVPGIRSNTGLMVSYRQFNLSWHTGHTGRIYVTPDNSDFLSGFVINDIKAGFKMKLGGNSLDLQLDLKNLFDVSYQVIAMHPMPGRYFSFGVLYNIVI